MLQLPKKCYVNKFIAKKTFYDKVGISNSTKEDFVNKIDRITWLYKLSQDKIGIPKTEEVEEIEVFELELKEKTIPYSIIKAITKPISYKILFVLNYNGEYCYAVKLEEIYTTEWNEELIIDLNAINLEILFEKIVKAIIKEETNNNSFNEIIENKNKINYLTKEIENQRLRVKREKQFDRKVELNNDLNKMLEEMENIKNE